MDLADLDLEYELKGLGTYNVVIGKNGCGKSRLLKAVERSLRAREQWGTVRYISPERAGELRYEPGVESSLAEPSWENSRRQNQAPQFRQQSAAQFRRLELLELRAIEQDVKRRKDPDDTFDRVVDQINTLLDRVFVRRGDRSFEIRDRDTEEVLPAAEISSGESELISLGIECLVFKRDATAMNNLLLLDEPDVHLHPDLQGRFAQFLAKVVGEANQAGTPMRVLVATHSTAFLGALTESTDTRIAFMRGRDVSLRFTPIKNALRKVLPVFGAHPLSNVFNETPVLLVEGEDDERIWQQAVRSSNGEVRVYPVAVDSITKLAEYETSVADVLGAVYDDAVGYSIRDRDDAPTDVGLQPVGSVVRFRLQCRAAENLLLTDDVLQHLDVSWDEVCKRISEWIDGLQSHPNLDAMTVFAKDGFNRKDGDLKQIRNDLVGLLGSQKPWEVLVGQAIARCAAGGGAPTPDSIESYLGNAAFKALVRNGS